MDDELRELYQETILAHGRHPRNRGPLEGETHHAEGHNPLCGDHVTIHAQLEGDVVRKVTFEGSGCAISTAAASTLTEMVAGHTLGEVEAMFTDYHELVTGRRPIDQAEHLGKLQAFGGVAEFPLRVKCATLAWHTLRAALGGTAEAVSTE